MIFLTMIYIFSFFKEIGGTALGIACYRGLPEMTKLLLNKNANTEIGDGTHKFTPLHHVCKREYLTSETNESDINRKFIDEHNIFECLKHLVNHKADVNAKDGQNNSPIIYAAKNSLQSLKYLIENKADVNATDREGKTLLHIAAEFAQTDIVKYLLGTKVLDVNAKDKANNTPLHIVESEPETCKLLITAGNVLHTIF
jgi:ankyrin repeat protein